MDFSPLEVFLKNLVKTNITPSVDCIVTKDNKEIFRYFFGFSNIENKVKISGNEEYLIFSMTKLLTCVCALQLFEKGLYSLDDPINKFLPEFSEMSVKTDAVSDENQNDITTGKTFGETNSKTYSSVKKASTPITVRHLFSMSAGFNYDLHQNNIEEAKKSGCKDTKSIVSSFSKAPLEFEPGTHFRYSLCHDVLGALIEVWSGKKFSEYLYENICKPLGLEHTYFSKYDNSDNKNLLKLYTLNHNGFTPKKLVNQFTLAEDYESGGAGLISTTEDYSIFIRVLANNGLAENGYRLLKKETIDLMKTNQLNSEQYADFQSIRDGYGYGLGVRVHMYPEVSKSISPVGEFGWDGAAGAFSMIDTENNLSLTYFQHCHGWDKATQHELRNKLYQCLSGE